MTATGVRRERSGKALFLQLCFQPCPICLVIGWSSQATTRAAFSTLSLKNCIKEIERVPSLTIALPAFHCGKIHPAQHICAICYRIEVGWIHTGGDTTQMIDIQALGDGASFQSKRKPMSQYDDAVMAPYIESPITFWVYASDPQPTCFRPLHLGPKQSNLLRRKKGDVNRSSATIVGHRKYSPFGVAPWGGSTMPRLCYYYTIRTV